MAKLSSDAFEPVVRSLCEAIDTPRSLSVWLCFKYSQSELVDLSSTDFASNDTFSVGLHYFLSEYLSKYKGLKCGINTADVALGKWRLSETQCRSTNEKFRGLQLRPTTGRVEGTLYRARRKIAAVLGSLHPSVALGGCKWGPGATFDLRRDVATPDNKHSLAISVTAAALPWLRCVVESDPHWSSLHLGGEIPSGAFSFRPEHCPYRIVRGSRFLTVPKSAKTDRCIAAEPTGNSFLQQGVHDYMRRRLRRFGVNLDDQSINQRYARDAYTSELSTLDLSAASDTISRELVYDLLPLDWAFFLDSLCSHETLVGDEWVRLQKFASMGNAFCFELETLIFWALCGSVDGFSSKVDVCSVYGDDLIVSRKHYDSSVEILEFCGFTINEKKSFKDGNFFESCGKHYHRGRDITPVYQKEVVSTPSEIIRAHNRLYRLWKRGSLYGIPVHRALKRLRNSYPLTPFPRVPFGVSEDGGFLVPFDELRRDPNRGFRCHVLDYVPRYIEAREAALYSYKLRRPWRTNPDVRGWAFNVHGGRWRTKVRWVPWQAVFSDLDAVS